jgi:hypothetical protein
LAGFLQAENNLESNAGRCTQNGLLRLGLFRFFSFLNSNLKNIFAQINVMNETALSAQNTSEQITLSD